MARKNRGKAQKVNTRKRVRQPHNANTISLVVHSQLLATNEIDTNFIQVNIAPQLAAFQTAVAMSQFYQAYTVETVRWKIINQKPVNVLLANGAHYSVPRYYKVDLVNDQIPDAAAAEYLKYQRVSTGILNGVLQGQFTPYSSVVGDQDRAFRQKQQVTTSNLNLYNYGCSILVQKNVTSAANQLFALTVQVSAVIKFHHFDGIAAMLKNHVNKQIKAKSHERNDFMQLQLDDSDGDRKFSLKQLRTLLLREGIQPNPGPDSGSEDQPSM